MRSKNNGITLITLVITIIVMMILAGVTISTFTGDNGLITKAIEAKEKSKMAAIKEQVDFVKMEWDMDKMLNPNLTITDFWNKLIAQGIIDSADDDVEETETGVYTIITKDGYEIEVTVDPNGNIQIGDISSGNELLHKIRVTTTSTNSITVKATVGRKYSGAKLSYYYKQDGDTDYSELDGKQNTSDLEVTIPDLTASTKYHIKVVAKAGKETKALETTGTTKTPNVPGASQGLTEGNIIASTTWNANKATVTLTTGTNYQIQWQSGEFDEDGEWATGNSPVTIGNLDLNATIYARLWDGRNGGSYASVTVEDGIDPSAKIIITTATVEPGDKLKATVTLKDSESGINYTACKWEFTESKTLLGEDTSSYTGTFNGDTTNESEEIEFETPASVSSDKEYWLHVLTVDNAGNKIEIVSGTSAVVGNADGDVTFSTDYGLIDVLWLDGTTNTISETPNLPTQSSLTSAGMTKVTWTKNGTTWTEDETPDDDEWGKYNAASGTTDSKNSQWANAKRTEDESYFVWIPRYAYRIKYYSDANYTTLTGYYDGNGMWRASDGKRKVLLDNGAETVDDGNGNKYIVHPSFTDNVDLGGWKTPIRGFWTAKYEMSQETKSGSTWSPSATASATAGNVETSSTIRAVSKPYTSSSTVTSWRYIGIGNMYTNSYNYDRAKESHLMKNSEWGAVAYLTQSKYGRNGHEVDINSCSSYYPGNGGGAVGGTASRSESIQNCYNTTTGAGASTTGNIYGVYDMSGGVWEYVAAWDVKGNSSYISSYGSSFASSATSTTNKSNEYATAYLNGTDTYYGNDILFKVGKVGDATKEVNTGGSKSLTDKAWQTNWFGDYSGVVGSNYPFFTHGGHYDNGTAAGVFAFALDNGKTNLNIGFRVVLAP